MADSSLILRRATRADAPSCAAIYLPYVVDTVITFEVDPPSPGEFARRIEDAQADHDWLVAESDGDVVGYAYGHRFAERAAYGWSCETSVYISRTRRREGIGRALYEQLLTRLVERGYRRAFAGITLPNQASVELHRAFGFTDSGRFRRVGWKQEAWHDVAWMQCDLQTAEIDPPTPRTST